MPQTARLFRQDDENRLGHVLGQVRIAMHLPPCRGVNQVEVPPHQRRKRRLRAARAEFAKQLCVVHARRLFKRYT
jgi:hypothetical protein